jgi:hypothetical protein
MKRLVIAMLALALLAGSTGAADAKKKRTYCQKAVRAEKGKVVAKRNGVTVYTRGRSFSACSDAKKKVLGLYILEPGTRISLVAAANKRCVAIKWGGSGKLDQILFKDLAGKEIGSSVTIVGYNYPAGVVGSLSVSKNCVAAWGEAVTDASGAVSFRVRLKAFGAASDVQSGIVHEIATVAAPDDIKHVRVKAVGRKVTVTWTQAGAPQSMTLPAG